MALTYAAKGGADFEKLPPGTHIAVCNLVADVGLQPGSPAFPDPKHKIFLRFEVPAERTSYQKDGADVEGPMTIYANFTASMNGKANLRKALEGWRGKKFTDAEAEKFDVSSVLGKACQILVMHSDDGKYANVNGLMPLPKGVAAPKAENPLILYSTESDADYDKLPKFLREKVDNQLDAAPVTHTGPLQRAAAPRTTDAEADRIAAQQADKGSPSLDPDDAIPFAPISKRGHI